MSTVPTTAPGKLPAGGTGDPTRGLAVVVDKIVSAIVDTGDTAATLDQHGQPYRGSGVIVALPEFSAPVLPLDVFRGMKRESIAWLVGSWVRGRAPEVIGTFLRPRYYGVWSDGKSLYLDVVEAWPGDRELDAIRAGRERNQVSVWHAGRQVEIQTGGTGEVAHHAPFRGEVDDDTGDILDPDGVVVGNIHHEDSDDFPAPGPWGCDDDEDSDEDRCAGGCVCTPRERYEAGELIIDPEGTGPGFYVIHESEPVWGPGTRESADDVADRYRNAHTSVTVQWQDSAE